MGNYRFKFSDMIPNAWFYKLKDFTKQPTRNFTKKKLHQNSSLVSNPDPLNSPPHTTSPSSSSRDKQSQYQRKSYYFTRDVNQPASPPIHDASSYHINGKHRHGHGSIYKEADGIVLQPPRRSSKKRRSTRRSRASPRLVISSIPAGSGYSCRSTIESVKTNNNPDSTSQEYPNSAADTSSETESILQPIRVVPAGVTTSTDSTLLSSCTWSSRLEEDIINNLKSRPPVRQFFEHVDDKRNPCFDSVSNIDLPSIKTKGIDIINKESEPTIIRRFGKRTGYGSLPDSMKPIVKKDEKSNPQVKRFSVSSHSPGVKLRTNSPRIITRRIHGRKSISPRRSLSESFAVVKSSKDPEKDFRDSMVEMIVEHNIWSSKELEDLLTCYLSLNSYKYHDIIIRVFKQIWFEFRTHRII